MRIGQVTNLESIRTITGRVLRHNILEIDLQDKSSQTYDNQSDVSFLSYFFLNYKINMSAQCMISFRQFLHSLKMDKTGPISFIVVIH